jgi:PKD repeat protein
LGEIPTAATWRYVALLSFTLAACERGPVELPETRPEALQLPAADQAPVAASAETTVVEIRDYRFSPNYLTIPFGRTVRFNLIGPKGHTATDQSGLSLYNSGNMRPGDVFDYTFSSAGSFSFNCLPHPTMMRGAVQVPVQVSPTAGTVGAMLVVTWASQAPAAGLVYEAHVLEPGTTTWKVLAQATESVSGVYVPARQGLHQFRARLKSATGTAASGWSPSRAAYLTSTVPSNYPPISAFEVNCSGLICRFTDRSTDVDGSVAAWSWTLGDGVTSTEREPTRTFGSSRSYTISLRVTDDGGTAGNTNSRSLIPYNDYPYPDFSVACTGFTCSFTDLSTDSDGSVTAWDWVFGDGTGSAERNPTHTYPAAGDYKVELRVTDSGGYRSGADTLVVRLEAANTAPFASFTYSCSGLTCAFADQSVDSDGQVVLWMWSFDDGTQSALQNPVHTFPVPGTYRVILRVTDNDGAQSEGFYKDVMPAESGAPANQAPVANFGFSCTQLTCVFTDSSTDADGSVQSWSWTFGDGQVSSEQNPVVTYPDSGTYTVTLTVADDQGLASVPASRTVIVSAAAITLTAVGYRGANTYPAVDLTWSGANGPQVDLYRNNVLLGSPINDGFLTDNTLPNRRASYVYRVCERGSTVCSNEAFVVF